MLNRQQRASVCLFLINLSVISFSKNQMRWTVQGLGEHKEPSSKLQVGFDLLLCLPQYQAAMAFKYQNYNLCLCVLCYYTVEQAQTTLVQRGTQPRWTLMRFLSQGLFSRLRRHNLTCSSPSPLFFLSFFLF